jgi:hypothetical protein
MKKVVLYQAAIVFAMTGGGVYAQSTGVTATSTCTELNAMAPDAAATFLGTPTSGTMSTTGTDANAAASATTGESTTTGSGATPAMRQGAMDAQAVIDACKASPTSLIKDMVGTGTGPATTPGDMNTINGGSSGSSNETPEGSGDGSNDTE